MPRTKKWSLSGTEALLMGTAFARHRTDLKVSRDGLALGSHHTEEWFAAIEAGKITITRPMAAVLTIQLYRHKRSNPFNADRVANQLRKEPYGEVAASLRELVARPAPSTGFDQEQADEPELIGRKDQILALGPWLLGASVIACAIFVVDFALSGVSSVVAPDSAYSTVKAMVLPAGLFGTACAALGIRAANDLVGSATRLFRTDRLQQHVTEIGHLCELNDVDWLPDRADEIDSLLPYLLPRYRSKVSSAMLRVQLVSRCVLALGLGLIVAGLAVVLVAHERGTEDWALTFPISLVVLELVAIAACLVEAGRSARDVYGSIARGLGYDFESDVPTAAELELLLETAGPRHPSAPAR